MTHEHPDDFDSPWKEALEQALPDFLALFFPQAHAGLSGDSTPIFPSHIAVRNTGSDQDKRLFLLGNVPVL